jgi:hypothetical protein
MRSPSRRSIILAHYDQNFIGRNYFREDGC